MHKQSMTTLNHILVPTDFSDNCSEAVQYACDLASDAGATLHFLHVVPGKSDDRVRDQHLQKIGAQIDAQTELSLKTVKHVVEGIPDRAIVNFASENGIDLIAMSTHGRKGLSHLTMGSTTERVVRSAPCPVVVIGQKNRDNTTLDDAYHVLAAELTDDLPDDQEESRGRLLKKLVEKLKITSVAAIRMFDQLQQQKWLSWQSGRWTLHDDHRGVGNRKRATLVDVATDSQAAELISRGRQLRATDIHIDPISHDETLVRMRIDGQLHEYCRLQKSIADHLSNQLKIFAHLDAADPFHVHEGRVRLPHELPDLEVRLTAAPVVEGQAIALRLFDAEKVFLPLDHLGFSATALGQIERSLQSREGLVLVTGPTGSGKTTTVYSMLRSIGGPSQNIVSIEDPVEFTAPFVRQISVDPRHGLSMTEGLRTILRMDPDVLFVGEIRGPEEATIALQAAGSGKAVFSTMHTRSVASTISALRGLGVDERTLVASLSGVINQRLAARLCDRCKQSVELTDDQREQFQAAEIAVPDVLFNPNGCVTCNGTGYLGRIGIFEVVVLDHDLREALFQHANEHELEEALRSHNNMGIQADALNKAAAGHIRLEDATMIRWVG